MDIFTTMITPYLPDGQIDFDAVDRYVEWYAQNGLNGIFAVCQSSEIFYLSLEERVALNRRVYEKVQKIKAKTGKEITVVSSGHVSYDFNEQVRELNAICESGTDALIFITNRLDPYNEGDDVFIRNAERLIAQLPADMKLGLYECPYPYKRLVTPKILDWCIKTGRFYYMKDTCCDLTLLRERCAQVAGTQFKLLNANCQTLLESLRYGAQGYCGIMANFHPALYVRLCEQFEKDPQKADALQALLCSLGFSEGGLPYPISAKYHLCLEGIESALIARSRPTDRLSEYGQHCVRQMKALCDAEIAKGDF